MTVSTEQILKLAKQISFAAPLRKGKWSHSAMVPWELIDDLREALEAEGFDWRAGRKLYLENIANGQKKS